MYGARAYQREEKAKMVNKKAVTVLIMIVGICVAALSLGALARDRNIWYQEDFEGYREGSFVTPLTKQNNGWRQFPVEIASTHIVSERAHSGKQSLRLRSHYVSTHDFPKRSGEHWVRVYVNIESLPDRWFSVSLHNYTPSATAYMWFYADGAIEANQGDESGVRNMVRIGTWKPGVWYEVTFRVNSETREYDLVVKDPDGKVVAEALGFGFQHAKASDIEELQFMAPTDFASTIYIDDITFSSAPLD